MIEMFIRKIFNLAKALFCTKMFEFKLLQSLLTQKVGLGTPSSIHTLGSQVFQAVKVRIIFHIQIGVPTQARPWVNSKHFIIILENALPLAYPRVAVSCTQLQQLVRIIAFITINSLFFLFFDQIFPDLKTNNDCELPSNQTYPYSQDVSVPSDNLHEPKV